MVEMERLEEMQVRAPNTNVKPKMLWFRPEMKDIAMNKLGVAPYVNR